MLQALSRARSLVLDFLDLRAMVLIALAALAAFWIDPPLATTIFVWTIPGFLLFAGLAIIISKHSLPQISLARHVEEALLGNTASGLVVLGVCIVLGCLAIALATWGKPA